jgi:hypothetical protein
LREPTLRLSLPEMHHLDAERAGFTREGVVRSMPKPDGRRVDKTLFSLLPGESTRRRGRPSGVGQAKAGRSAS